MYGRLYAELNDSDPNLALSPTYYQKAINCFSKIEHYRGLYMSIKDWHAVKIR
jgi:hypothetical protein